MNKVNITFALLALLCTAVFAQQKGSFTDTRDKKTYKTVKIGKQTWLAENLNYEAKDSKCYDNKPDNCVKYGRLYNWKTAMEVCPAGWHLPSLGEGEALFAFVKESISKGNPLKAAGVWEKETPKSEHKDEFGFTALPSGYGTSDGKFAALFNGDDLRFPGIGKAIGRSLWWTRSDSIFTDGKNILSNQAASMLLATLASGIIESNDVNKLLSVRCIEGYAGSASDIGSFTDSRDNRKYKTIRIGHLNWMAENLDYNAKDSQCYDEKPDNCKKLGRLYDWETAMKACPAGWHLPTESEWAELEEIAGGKNYAGVMLKSKSDWKDYGGKSRNGRDKVGFTALPSGRGGAQFVKDRGKIHRFISYSDYGYAANFWYAEESVKYLSGKSVALGVRDGEDRKLSWNETGTGLFSVRCVKDK